MTLKGAKASEITKFRQKIAQCRYRNRPIDDIERFWSYVDIKGLFDCWEWKLSTNGKGYGLYKYKDKSYKCHRLSYELYFGKIEEGKHILHKCNNRLCVNPFHLYQGTNRDNVNDTIRANRQAIGLKSGKSKLTKEQILEIRENINHYSARKLGRIYGVSHNTIRMAQRGISYRDIKWEENQDG